MRGLELHRPHAVVAETETGQPNHGIFVAQPFERGWGVTVGNALRRILLSSIQGAAVVAVRIAGVDHEYDSIPGVMEDVTDLILNVRRVPLRVHVESLTATLRASEPGTLTAGAIDGGSELEIVDPSVYLATLSEEGAVDAELVIRQGRGFVPADEQERRDLGVGFIFLDAAFSPVRNANYRIEPARVGQATDYEKLVLEVWTNGTITPVEAVAEASRLLAEHLPIFVNLEGEVETPQAPAGDSVLDRPIGTLEVGVRILNMLRAANVATIRDLVAYNEDELQKLPGLGKKAVAEVRDRLEVIGLELGMRLDLPRS